MNVHEMPKLLVRLPKAEKAWLAVRAAENNRSMNAEILDLMQSAMQADPLEIFVHECHAPTGDFYSVSVGKDGEDFLETESREAAFNAARTKAKELGLSSKAIRLNVENFNA